MVVRSAKVADEGSDANLVGDTEAAEKEVELGLVAVEDGHAEGVQRRHVCFAEIAQRPDPPDPPVQASRIPTLLPKQAIPSPTTHPPPVQAARTSSCDDSMLMGEAVTPNTMRI